MTAAARRILMVLDIRLTEEASLTNVMIFDLKVNFFFQWSLI